MLDIEVGRAGNPDLHSDTWRLEQKSTAHMTQSIFPAVSSELASRIELLGTGLTVHAELNENLKIHVR